MTVTLIYSCWRIGAAYSGLFSIYLNGVVQSLRPKKDSKAIYWSRPDLPAKG